MDAEQVARNDAIFREANEQIREAADRLGVSSPVPFICECAEPACREVIRVTLPEYERVRSDPARFIVAHGHESGEHAQEVEQAPEYTVVEKVGEAAQVAVELDPRSV